MLRAPFPYFGGKARAAALVWAALGDVRHYVEPFLGSAAVLLARPEDHAGSLETVNDADGYVANFWRALSAEPDEVAANAWHPVFENDLHARHAWLLEQGDAMGPRLEGDPDYYDPKVAGWWAWGMSCWIGSGWCNGIGPWRVVDGELRRVGGAGVWRKRPHLTGAQGVMKRTKPHISQSGRDVRRGDLAENGEGLRDYLRALAERLARVRVLCGDWARVCTDAALQDLRSAPCGVFLDPPYSDRAERERGLYAIDSMAVAEDVRRWAIERGENARLRIVLAGYEGEHDMPASWRVVPWTASGGMGNFGDGQGKLNRHRERLWLSPHCLEVPGAEPVSPKTQEVIP